MESEYRKIAGYRGHITRFINYIKDGISQESEQDHLESLNSTLLEKWNKYNSLWEEFVESYEDEDDHETREEAHVSISDKLYGTQLELSLYRKKLAANKATALSPGQPANPSPNVKVKLPEIRLKEFYGDTLDWTRFWNQFSASVDSRKDLDDVTKYIYLTQCVKGPAQSVLAGFRGKASDYGDAIKALQKSYADKGKIRRTLVRSLANLKTPKYTKSEIFNFKIQIDNLLMQMDHDPDFNVSASELLISELICLKLSREVEKFLHSVYHTVYFTVDQIKDGLQQLVDILRSDDKPQNQKPANIDKSASHQQSETSSHSNSNSSAVGTYSSFSNYSCIYCKGGHRPSDCTNYSTVSSRRDRLRAINRCVKCVKFHNVSDCKTVIDICRRCKKGKHHSFLCINPFAHSNHSESVNTTDVSSQSNKGAVSKKRTPTKRGDAPPISNDSSQFHGDPVATSQVMTIMESRNSNVNYSVALPTATVTVRSDNGNSVKTRCFFDCGSQRSFIHKDLANQLGLKRVAGIDMALSSFDNDGNFSRYEIVNPVISLGNRRKRVIMAVVSKMPRQIVTPGLSDTAVSLKKMGYRLADTEIDSDVVENIHVMIGSDFLGRYLSGTATIRNVDLFESPDGYLIYGIIPNHLSTGTVQSNSSLVAKVAVQQMEISPLLTEPRTVNSCVVHEALPVHKLWDLDVVGINPVQESPSNIKACSQYESTLKYDDGRYWVELPFKHDHPYLPNNYKLALAHMYNQVRRFKNEPHLLACYDRIIKEQLELGYIEDVKSPVVSASTHYLPHHAVMKDSASTPLRIVYNCSARMSKASASLNDCLMTGPSLTEKLCNSLLKFRSNKYGCVADIEKAFLQVGLQSHHRDFTRFLWPEDPFNVDSKVNTYRFRSVLFGATCSPFLLQMTLQYHFKNSTSPYADVLSSAFYVDNLLLTLDDEQELLRIYDVAKEELGKAGMNLSQWNTNSELLKTYIKSSEHRLDVPVISKVLGLNWDISDDTLSLNHCHFEELNYVTKRQLLSLVSTCFDPLGMCAPILIKGKCLIQSAWREQIGWDVHLPPVYLSKWREIVQEISELPLFKFPRCVCHLTDQYRLHAFVDASTAAYGVVCYLSDKEKSIFIASKARVAPLKTRTLPQLELTALQLGVQFAHYLQKLLQHFCIDEVVIWSDSEAALQWIRNNNSKIAYVQNRVANIREIGSTFKFLHVPSKENLADLITRGISIKQFRKNEAWIHGHSWLPYPEQWPTQKSEVVICEIVSETLPALPVVETLFDYTKFSSLQRLLSVTKYVFKFIQSCKPNMTMSDPLVYWIQQAQRTHYPQICGFLTKESDSLNKENQQFIKDLGLYVSEPSGLVHSRGRLHHAVLDEGTKFPILVPTKSHLAQLLIVQAHEKSLHGGVQETLALIRSQYWMPKCRQTIKSVISRCTVCKRVEGRRFGYPGPPPLPAERVQLSRPFEHVGIDYSGSITITKTEDGKPHKYYIVLFTCTASRLVHLELASNLSASSFINLFRRFCAAYSLPTTVILDNGTNFIASAKYFEEMFGCKTVTDYMECNKIRWKFIAPRAPWQGGFYERMIGLTKSCLKKVLFKKRVNREELETVLKEIQCKLNNRPLTYIEEEGSVVPLAPIHLWSGRLINPLPSVVIDDQLDPEFLDHNDLNLRYSQVSTIINQFGRLWKGEYLTALREKHYGATKAFQNRVPQVGDVVIVERQGSQHEWPLGRIVKLRPDSENVTRVVDVLCDGVISKRTLDKLVPLEIRSPCAEPSGVQSEELQTVASDIEIPEEGSGNGEAIRPRRQAAQEAAKLRQALIESQQL